MPTPCVHNQVRLFKSDCKLKRFMRLSLGEATAEEEEEDGLNLIHVMQILKKRFLNRFIMINEEIVYSFRCKLLEVLLAQHTPISNLLNIIINIFKTRCKEVAK